LWPDEVEESFEEPVEAIWPGGTPARIKPRKEEARSPRKPHIAAGQFATPRSREEGLIRLFARDPKMIYTYWELSPALISNGLERLGAKGASARLALRLYEVKRDGSLRLISDTALNDSASDWYLELKVSGLSWLVEIGWLSQDGAFLGLARSNAVKTPPETAAAAGAKEALLAQLLPSSGWSPSSAGAGSWGRTR
jgi:hypothetical protein